LARFDDFLINDFPFNTLKLTNDNKCVEHWVISTFKQFASAGQHLFHRNSLLWSSAQRTTPARPLRYRTSHSAAPGLSSSTDTFATGVKADHHHTAAVHLCTLDTTVLLRKGNDQDEVEKSRLEPMLL